MEIKEGGLGREITYTYDKSSRLIEAEERIKRSSLPGSYDFWLARVDYENNAVYYYLRDALGSVTALVDGRGKVVKRYFYSPYGKLRGFTGWGERMMGMMGKRGRRSTANPLTYTGREYDKSTQLYYYRARYYNPSVGRFISVDPLVREIARFYGGGGHISGGSSGCGECEASGRGRSVSFSIPPVTPSLSIQWRHPYVYARDNPVNYVDPEGKVAVLMKGGCCDERGFHKGKTNWFRIQSVVGGSVGPFIIGPSGEIVNYYIYEKGIKGAEKATYVLKAFGIISAGFPALYLFGYSDFKTDRCYDCSEFEGYGLYTAGFMGVGIGMACVRMGIPNDGVIAGCSIVSGIGLNFTFVGVGYWDFVYKSSY